MANEHAHNHGHMLTHDHDDYGKHDHRFSHTHEHAHGDDGVNDHDKHEHIELDGPVFPHREHHINADDPSPMVAPGDAPPPGQKMDDPDEPSHDPMNPPGDQSGKSRSIWWGE